MLPESVRLFFTPKAIVFGATIFLLIYVRFEERRIQDFSGCWNCGWQTRQALPLFVAAASVLVLRWWTALLAFLTSLKVAASVTFVGVLDNPLELERPWPILKSSCGINYERHPEFFFEIGIALFLTWVSSRYIYRILQTRFLTIE